MSGKNKNIFTSISDPAWSPTAPPLSRLLCLSTFGFGRYVTIATQFSKENIHHAYSLQFNPQKHPSKGAIVAQKYANSQV